MSERGMWEINPRHKQISTILLYGLITILLIDYVLANGGYHTILPAYHPIMVGFSSILIVSLLIWNFLRAVELAAKRQWGKALLIILCLVIILFGTKIAVKTLAEKSKERAYDVVNLFFSESRVNSDVQIPGESDQDYRFFSSHNFDVQMHKEVEQDYRFFLSHYDPSAIQLLYSFPPHGRYDYLVTPKSGKAFMLTLWVSDHGGRILIVKRWDKHMREKK